MLALLGNVPKIHVVCAQAQKRAFRVPLAFAVHYTVNFLNFLCQELEQLAPKLRN